MSKAVLISIRPKWCELIAEGKKTIEVRKTRPKLGTPFKCYIYCTKPKYPHEDFITVFRDEEEIPPICFYGGGKVIGEFVCDGVIPMSIKYSDPNSHLALKEFPHTCLTDKEIIDYLGNGGNGYGWHISDLVIYDTPKELGEFHKTCIPACNFSNECGGTNATGCLFGISRPPQSWCYVEELI